MDKKIKKSKDMANGLADKVLSRSQMETLRKLGVDTSQASVVLIFSDDDGDTLDWGEVAETGQAPDVFVPDEDIDIQYMDAVSGNYDHSFREDCGVFCLEDILAMLPNNLVGGPDKRTLFKLDFGFSAEDSFYQILYKSVRDGVPVALFYDSDPLKAAYCMLHLLARKGYIYSQGVIDDFDFRREMSRTLLHK